jgi:DNA-binding CsgD family transcriptional regulator
MQMHDIPSAYFPNAQIHTVEDLFTSPRQHLAGQFNYICDLVDQTLESVYGTESVLGFTPDDFANIPFFGGIHPDDRDTVIAIINEGYQHLRDHKEIELLKSQFSITCRFICKDGSYRHIQHVITFITMNSYGDALKVFNMCNDISQLPFEGVTAFLRCKCMGIGAEFAVLQQKQKSIYDAIAFSAREQEILQFLHLGKTSQEVADILCISKHTVDKHRSNMLNKTNTANTRELINIWLTHFKG